MLRVFAVLILLGTIASFVATVQAACECGYRVVVPVLSIDQTAVRSMDHLSTASDIKFYSGMAGKFYTSSDKFSTSSASNFAPRSINNFSISLAHEFTAGSEITSYVFTDVIESDFFHITDIHADTDWLIQGYNVTASAARGPFG